MSYTHWKTTQNIETKHTFKTHKHKEGHIDLNRSDEILLHINSIQILAKLGFSPKTIFPAKKLKHVFLFTVK